MAIQLGDILGDYQVIGILGRGGMGKVFRVRSLLTDREEAMKVLLPDFDEQPELADRFLREIKVHARLAHPNIAALRTALRIEERLFMLMELVEGASLAEKLRDGPLSVPASVECMTQVLSALAYAHDAGVIHRDIKPANILIAHDGTVKITDFGIARTTDTTRVTSTGNAVGTLAYMSPEQVRGDVVDARSDVYSVGLTLYEMVTGCRAMQGDTNHSLMNAQLWVMPAEPVHVNPTVPRWMSAAIMRALAKQPDQRFQSAAAFKAALTGDDATVVVAAEPRTPMPSVTAPTAPTPTPAAPIAAGTPATGPGASAIHGSSPPASQPGSQPGSSPGSQPGTFDPVTLDRLTQALAPYLGPIAKVLVTRAARRARNLQDLQGALAAEIPSEEDRRRFISRVRSAL